MAKLKILKPKKKVEVEPELKVEEKVETVVEEPKVEVEKPVEKLLVRGPHKYRKVTVNHSCGDVTTKLELVE